MKDINSILKKQDEQLNSIKSAEAKYEIDGNIDSLIRFWENIWDSGGLLFNGSRWAFRLSDLLINQKDYDKALKYLKKIKNPIYKDKKESYIRKVRMLKEKIVKK